MNETWKAVPNCSGYFVSDLGRVSSSKWGRTRILKPSRHPRGYCIVTVGNVCKTVHRLVALAFLGESDLQVNHRNGDKADNRLCNLEYISPAENVRHAISVLGVAYGGNRRRAEKTCVSQ